MVLWNVDIDLNTQYVCKTFTFSLWFTLQSRPQNMDQWYWLQMLKNGINQKSIPLFVYLRVYLIIVYWINQFLVRINLFRHLWIPWSWDLLICSHAFLVWMQNAILQQMRPNADIGGTKKPNVHISITVT